MIRTGNFFSLLRLSQTAGRAPGFSRRGIDMFDDGGGGRGVAKVKILGGCRDLVLPTDMVR